MAHRTVVTLAFCSILTAAIGLASFAHPAGAATPAALQYEQIVRVVMPPATPVPPGAFQDDRSAIMAAANNPPPQHRGLFAGVQNAYANAMGSMRELQTGSLLRYTYYHNWVRTDDVVRQTAVIVKCDQHQYITLDLAHHTYTVSSTVPSPQAAPAPGMAGPPETNNAQPGTADLTLSATRTNLGPRTIESVNTQGDASSISVVMANATGSCRNGSFSMQLTEYVSGIGIPRAYCPLPHLSQAPAAGQTYVSGGCRPRMHGSMTGMAGIMGSSDQGAHLAMYRVVSMGAAQSNGQTIGSLTESGNVRWLDDQEAQALFTIPPGFTQQQ